MKRFLSLILAVAATAAAVAWVLSASETLDDETGFPRAANVENGRIVFYAGGCASCHSAVGAQGGDKLLLSGGRAFASPFGTFYAPNISPDPEFGIGEWSALDLANAMMKGVSPDGQHYYPAFPYPSYSRIKVADVVDLHAFLATLPASSAANLSHDLPLPFRVRRALGLWKLLYLNDRPIADVPPELARGQYLVESLGHCGECHTPRNAIGSLNTAAWLAGAPSPEGKGRVPNITPHLDGLGGWSAADIAYYLQTGFTPEFDSVGGVMVDVVENMEHLSAEDRLAIAQYLKALPEVAGR